MRQGWMAGPRFLAIAFLTVVPVTAFAQTAPPPAQGPQPAAPSTTADQVAPQGPPPAGGAPPSGGYGPPPGGDFGQTAPGYAAPPPGYAAPPPGYPPPAGYAPPTGYGAAPPSPYGGAGVAAPAPGSYPPPPPPGYAMPPPYAYAPPLAQNTHDGFFLRMHLGVGHTRISGSNGIGGDTIFSGVSGSLGIALGGIIAPNLALYGAFLASIASDADVESNGVSLGTVNGSAGIFGFGVGAAYYLQPINLFFSGTLAAVQFDLSDANDDTVYESKFGLGFQGMIGKEWWVSPEWGLGIAAELIAASMKDKQDSTVTWNALALSLLFSATCN